MPTHDLAQLERLLAASTAPTKLIAVDAVYSMDGDCAPLAALLALAERFDAWLYVDDAHGFGVLGEGARQWSKAGVRSERLIQMVTLGKAAGVASAAVAAHAVVIDWLVNSAHGRLSSPPALRRCWRTPVQASLRLMADEPERRRRCVPAWPSSSTNWRACRGPCCRRTRRFSRC